MAWPAKPTPTRVARHASPLPEIRPVTALFADIVGSTALGEYLPPEDVQGVVGECVSRMTNAIEAAGGLVTSFMGDGVAAFFGLEATREDDATRACVAALRILRVVEECAAEAESIWGVRNLAVRVGVNSGRVGTGLVGGAQPQSVALGDPVNVAARLQGAAEPGSILVGGRTAARVGAFFERERVGALELKGKSHPVDAWKLVRFVGNRTDDVHYSTRFVGRTTELEQLTDSVNELVDGRARIITIVGEAGLGKTRLLAEVSTRSHVELQWLRARCYDHAVGVPLGAFVTLLRGWLGLAESTPNTVARVRLLTSLKQLPDLDADVSDFLCRLLSLPVSPEAESVLIRLAPDTLWERIRNSCVSWVASLSRQNPLVIAFDDFDRADSLTVEVVREVLALVDVAPISVVLVLRPEAKSAGWSVRVRAHADYSHRTVELRLAPMKVADCQAIIDSLDQTRLIPPDLRQILATRAEGNPFFLEELTTQVLGAGAGGLEASASVRTSDIPSALESVLLARIDRLPPATRRTAQVAAVCGRRFLRQVAAGAIGREQFDRDLPILLRAGLLREEGRTTDQAYAFTHGLLRDAVLSTVPPARIQELHESVANSIEALGDFTERLSLLASHYASSPNVEKALHYLERAADDAVGRAFLGDAIEKYRASVDLSLDLNRRDDCERASVKLADLYAQLGRFDDALAIWSDLIERAPSSQEATRFRIRAARVLFDAGDFDAMRVVCDAAEMVDDRQVKAELAYLRARVAMRAVDYAEARRQLEQIESSAADELTSSMNSELATVRSFLYAVEGDHREATLTGESALRLAQTTGDVDLLLRVKRDIGITKLVLGDPMAARELLADVYETSRKLGRATRALDVASNLLSAYSLLGEVRRGVELGRDLLTWVTNPFWRAAFLVNLGDLEILLGDRAAAATHVEEALNIAASDDWGQVSVVLAKLAQVNLIDNPERARIAASAVLDSLEAGTGRPDLEVTARVMIGAAAFEEGRIDLAQEQALKALASSEEWGLPHWISATCLAALAFSSDDPVRFEPELWRALEECRMNSTRIQEAEVLGVLGVCLRSDAHFDDAESILFECESRSGLQALRKLREMTGLTLSM